MRQWEERRITTKTGSYYQFGFRLSASKKDVHSSHYKLCSRDFDIGNMSKSAKGENHHAKVPSGNPMTLYLESESSSSGQSTSSQATSTTVSIQDHEHHQQNLVSPPSGQQSLSTYMLQSNVSEAEILWVLNFVQHHHSLRSCSGLSNLFSRMFNDSAIAK